MSSMASEQIEHPSEETPLLTREEQCYSEDAYNSETVSPTSSGSSPVATSNDSKASILRKRWPSIAALGALSCAMLLIMISGFFAPAAMKEYVSQAIYFEPTTLSLESFTASGAVVRIEGSLTLNASRVSRTSVRNLGRLATWIAKEVEIGQSEVQFYLPAYENALAGTFRLPSVKIDVQDSHQNDIRLHAEVMPGPYEVLRDVTSDWIEGRAEVLKIFGEAEISVKSGLLNFGKRDIKRLLELRRGKAPSLPKYAISRFDIHEKPSSGHKRYLEAGLELSVENRYAIDLAVPSLGYEIMIKNCALTDPLIPVGTAITRTMHITPKSDLKINVIGKIGHLPSSLTSSCPNSDKSPLDMLVRNYISGLDTTIYVRCSGFIGSDTPSWAKDLMDNIIVPVPFPARSSQHLLRSFSLANVHLKLPENSGQPGSPETMPQVSAEILAFVNVPKEMKFTLNVTRVAAKANVFFEQRRLGELDLSKWQKATASRNDSDPSSDSVLLVKATVTDAPLEVTDDQVLEEAIQRLLFNRSTVDLLIEASVDVELDSPVGQFIVRHIPANGTIAIKPPLNKSISDLSPTFGDLQIIETDRKSITFQAKVNFTNPTAYSLTVPFADIKLLSNGTIIGHAMIENCVVAPGNNTNLNVKAIYDPFTESGRHGIDSGRELLSQYVSGFNTTITLKAHNDTIPSQPVLGHALASFSMDFPTPRLHPPRDPNDPEGDKNDSPHFIRETRMHLLSSTAIFTLASPFTTTTLYITSINATALYHQSTVGRIYHDLPFAVPPGLSETPGLPVDWSLGSVGYEAVKKAIGGQLRLNATADVSVRIGRWEEQIWFVGHGIGAKIGL